MIFYKQAATAYELEQILTLQQKNLPKNLSNEEIGSQGFLTVEHTFAVLQEMNQTCPHIIATEKNQVVGYALCMHPKFSRTIEVLRPMFYEINQVVSKNENYLVMGQICIAKEFRGKGIFRGLYETMKRTLPFGFDHIITEVDTKNHRSMNAHSAIGFRELKRYTANGKEWSLIVLK
ncbi:MAG: GNAT family N-acetyltransferase [Bacteroidota bacterium]